MAAESTPTYRDAQLAKSLKTLRADIRTNPNAKRSLEKVEKRLKYLFRVLDLWDSSHAERCELLLRLGNIPAANTSATMIFDAELRARLLSRARIGLDQDTSAIADALAMDREVLN